jgi:hypothetical protein
MDYYYLADSSQHLDLNNRHYSLNTDSDFTMFDELKADENVRVNPYDLPSLSAVQSARAALTLEELSAMFEVEDWVRFPV